MLVAARSGRSLNALGKKRIWRLMNVPADVRLSLKPCLVSPSENKYVRVLASVLFQICQYAGIGQVDPLRVFPISARYLHQAFQYALRFGFDREFASRVEAAWTEVNRADYNWNGRISWLAVVSVQRIYIRFAAESARLQPARSPFASSHLARAIAAENCACRRSWVRFKEPGVGW